MKPLVVGIVFLVALMGLFEGWGRFWRSLTQITKDVILDAFFAFIFVVAFFTLAYPLGMLLLDCAGF